MISSAMQIRLTLASTNKALTWPEQDSKTFHRMSVLVTNYTNCKAMSEI